VPLYSRAQGGLDVVQVGSYSHETGLFLLAGKLEALEDVSGTSSGVSARVSTTDHRLRKPPFICIHSVLVASTPEAEGTDQDRA
jgi:hypothetical protein